MTRRRGPRGVVRLGLVRQVSRRRGSRRVIRIRI
jgi:hypothetical protein